MDPPQYPNAGSSSSSSKPTMGSPSGSNPKLGSRPEYALQVSMGTTTEPVFGCRIDPTARLLKQNVFLDCYSIEGVPRHELRHKWYRQPRDGMQWVEVGSSLSYTPTMEDIGCRLMLVTEVVDCSTDLGLMRDIIQTSPVRDVGVHEPRRMLQCFLKSGNFDLKAHSSGSNPNMDSPASNPKVGSSPKSGLQVSMGTTPVIEPVFKKKRLAYSIEGVQTHKFSHKWSSMDGGIKQVMQNIFVDYPMERLAELLRVSPEWRNIILSDEFARIRFEREVNIARPLQYLFIVDNVQQSLGFIGADSLVNNNRRNLCPLLAANKFPSIVFPLAAIVGSSQGLICVLDREEQLFVINPLTHRYRNVIGHSHPYRAYGFGYQKQTYGKFNVNVKILDSHMHTLAIFNLTTNQWRNIEFERNEIEGHYQIQERASGAFAYGSFLWLGRVRKGNVMQEAVLIFDASEGTVDHFELPPYLCGIGLFLGNIGPDVAVVWAISNDMNCFWIMNDTRGEFNRLDLMVHPSGTLFQPICRHQDSHMLLLRQNDEVKLAPPENMLTETTLTTTIQAFAACSIASLFQQ